tara:strand:+ start:623 stop:772 length:150 start_codon:yes stop_codon:yes gene_type:complete
MAIIIVSSALPLIAMIAKFESKSLILFLISTFLPATYTLKITTSACSST